MLNLVGEKEILMKEIPQAEKIHISGRYTFVLGAAERSGRQDRAAGRTELQVRKPTLFSHRGFDCTSRASRESWIQPGGTAAPDRPGQTGSLSIPSVNTTISYQFVNVSCQRGFLPI